MPFSFCRDLKSIHFELQAVDHMLELDDIAQVRPIFLKVATMLPILTSLERVTSRIFNGNFMANFFMASYIKEAILHLNSDLITHSNGGTKGLHALWIPHGGMSSTLSLVRPNCTALLTGEVSNSIMDSQELTSLCVKADARTANPRVLRDATSKLPRLLMISCAYNSRVSLDLPHFIFGIYK